MKKLFVKIILKCKHKTSENN